MSRESFIIQHDGATRIAWDLFLTLAAAAAYVAFSYRFTFRIAGADLFAWLVVLVFAVDIVLSFLSEVRQGPNVVGDRASIARRYLRSWFVPDVVAALPLLVFLLLAGAWGRGGESAGVLLAVGLLPLVKIAKLAPTFRRLQENLGITPAVMRLAVFVFLFMLAVHTMALGWILIGAAEAGRPARDQYLRSVYWCTTTIATIGYGDYAPSHESNRQIFYTIVVEIVGVGFYGYIIGNMASLIANIDVAKAAFLKRRDEVHDWLRSHQVPAELQKRVRDYYAYLWETRRSTSATPATAGLPPTLDIAIRLFLSRGIIEKVALFRGAEELFLREIVQRLEPLVFLPGDAIITQGEYGDCMYFLSEGAVEVLVGNRIVATLGPGSPFGETALLQHERRNATIRTTTYCEVYRLAREGFDALRRAYPDFDARVSRVVAERLADNRRQAGKTPAVRKTRAGGRGAPGERRASPGAGR